MMYVPTKLLNYANAALVLFVITFVFTLTLSYPLADALSIPMQIAAHIGTVVVAALIKISYVVRCVCQHQLGLEVK